MKRILLLALLLVLVPWAAAEAKHVTVLSVLEGNTSSGGLADVYLEVRPGTGSVYIDSFPLTKLDTQLSARFAREYACGLAARDCSRLDFFYVIRAPTTIIGGPSAGAAMTVLSYAALEDLDLREDTVMTGTINSGGLVGPVGGTEAKVSAAAANGFSRVLVPSLEYDRSLEAYPVEVIPVTDVEEAIWYFTGTDARPETAPVEVPEAYVATMASVAESLCARSERLHERVGDNRSEELLADAAASSARQEFYSSASYCFSANLQLRAADLADAPQSRLRGIYRQLEEDIDAFDSELPENLTSIADLEVYMIVRERLLDAERALDAEEYENLTADGVAYALERFSSAQAWSAFFGVLPSETLSISSQQLSGSCQQKLAEAEERLNYLSYLTGLPLEGTREEVDAAHGYAADEEWALCLFKATQARAEADNVIAAVYGGESFNESLAVRLGKVEQVLGQSAREGNFPILSYSYYEYARSLDDVYSSSLYAEYALALAGLDIYFPPQSPLAPIDFSRLFLLVAGFVVGAATGVLSWELVHRHREGRRKR